MKWRVIGRKRQTAAHGTPIASLGHNTHDTARWLVARPVDEAARVPRVASRWKCSMSAARVGDRPLERTLKL